MSDQDEHIEQEEGPPEVKVFEPRRFIVIGAGGIGSWLLEGLARMAEYRFPGSEIAVVDGDAFEPKNMERQNFEELGNKAQILTMDLQRKFHRTFFTPVPRWVIDAVPEGTEVEDDVILASELLHEDALVYAVVDNFAARKAVFDAAKEFDNIDVWTGGNDENLFGSVYHYCRRDGKEVIDHPTEWQPALIDPPDRNPGLLSCGERVMLEGATQTLAVNMAVAALLLARTEVVVVQGRDDEQSEVFFDLAVGLSQGFDRRVEEETAGDDKELVSSTVSNTGETST